MELFVFFFVILVIVTVVIILKMLVRGWRPYIDEEMEAFKRTSPQCAKILLLGPFVLCYAALRAMGTSRKTAVSVTICLAFLVLGALLSWYYKAKGKKKINKLENEINKWKDEQKQ